ETANQTIVITLNGKGKDQSRIEALKQTLAAKSDALMVELVETELPEELTPLTLFTQVCFLMNYLADALNVNGSFTIGDKITRVPDSAK
ncbi:MAG: hypothetical protein AAB538_04390, partial [Patescibacteria group bacterium]